LQAPFLWELSCDLLHSIPDSGFGRHRGRFPTNRRQGQSALLLREADHVVRLAAEDVASHLRLTPDAEAALVAATGAADGEMAEPDEFISTAAEEDAERSLGHV